jgi:hypothetical protein
VDARSDVWSVAVVLFEMLMGRPYFAADSSARLEVTIREYAAPHKDLSTLQAGVREIVLRALDPDVAKRFPSAASFEKALREWCAGGRAAMLAQDPEATRRTALPPRDKAAPRPRIALSAVVSGFNARVRKVNWKGVAVFAAILLFGVLGLLYAARVRHPAVKRVPIAPVVVAAPKPTPAAPAVDPARATLVARYATEADQTIADYREADELAPVSAREWKRAEAAINSALALAPDDDMLRGKYQVIEGHRKFEANDLRTARTNFEAASALLPKSPDPHLGLFNVFLAAGQPDKAAVELDRAKAAGFKPAPREQRALANGYVQLGERWIAASHGIEVRG